MEKMISNNLRNQTKVLFYETSYACEETSLSKNMESIIEQEKYDIDLFIRHKSIALNPIIFEKDQIIFQENTAFLKSPLLKFTHTSISKISELEL